MNEGIRYQSAGPRRCCGTLTQSRDAAAFQRSAGFLPAFRGSMAAVSRSRFLMGSFRWSCRKSPAIWKSFYSLQAATAFGTGARRRPCTPASCCFQNPMNGSKTMPADMRSNILKPAAALRSTTKRRACKSLPGFMNGKFAKQKNFPLLSRSLPAVFLWGVVY